MTINEIKKEHTGREWLAKIMNSWTWGRLTEEEKVLFIDNVLLVHDNIVKGTAKQRWSILNALYHAYLIGLGYHDTMNWREK